MLQGRPVPRWLNRCDARTPCLQGQPHHCTCAIVVAVASMPTRFPRLHRRHERRRSTQIPKRWPATTREPPRDSSFESWRRQRSSSGSRACRRPPYGRPRSPGRQSAPSRLPARGARRRRRHAGPSSRIPEERYPGMGCVRRFAMHGVEPRSHGPRGAHGLHALRCQAHANLARTASLERTAGRCRGLHDVACEHRDRAYRSRTVTNRHANPSAHDEDRNAGTTITRSRSSSTAGTATRTSRSKAVGMPSRAPPRCRSPCTPHETSVDGIEANASTPVSASPRSTA